MGWAGSSGVGGAEACFGSFYLHGLLVARHPIEAGLLFGELGAYAERQILYGSELGWGFCFAVS